MAYQNLASASVQGCRRGNVGERGVGRGRLRAASRCSKPSRNLNMEHNFHPKHVVGKSDQKRSRAKRHDGCQQQQQQSQQQQQQQQHGASADSAQRRKSCCSSCFCQAARPGSHMLHTRLAPCAPAILGMPCNYFGLKFVFCTNLVNASLPRFDCHSQCQCLDSISYANNAANAQQQQQQRAEDCTTTSQTSAKLSAIVV